MQLEHLRHEIPRVPSLVQPEGLQHRSHPRRRRGQAVVGHVREHVMRDVAVSDVMRQLVDAVSKLAVDRLQTPQHVLPLALFVRLGVVVVVLEVGHGEEPPAEAQVRRGVLSEPVNRVRVARDEGRAEKRRARHGGNRALHPLVLGRPVEEPGLRVEVAPVRPGPPRFQEEVPGKAEEGSPPAVQRQRPHDGVHVRVLLFRHPRVRHVLSLVVVKPVVLLVRVRPRVEGHEQRRVREVADDAVDEGRFGEGAVPAVVAHDEVHPHDGAREGRVQR
mmetsp:Transcript_9202/g.40501  ORF Transcript_9202/g.40501 Transcript_9202/m.40501 type:complete len:275 (+) Transcript_9202:892-1716(+)